MNCYIVYDPEFPRDGALMVKAPSSEEAKNAAADKLGYLTDPSWWYNDTTRIEFLKACVAILAPVPWE